MYFTSAFRKIMPFNFFSFYLIAPFLSLSLNPILLSFPGQGVAFTPIGWGEWRHHVPYVPWLRNTNTQDERTGKCLAQAQNFVVVMVRLSSASGCFRYHFFSAKMLPADEVYCSFFIKDSLGDLIAVEANVMWRITVYIKIQDKAAQWTAMSSKL